MKTSRAMPFESGAALFLSPDANGPVFVVVFRLWLAREGLRFPREDGE